MFSDPTTSEARMAFVFDKAPVGLCVSEHRIIQRCNEKFAAIFGYEVHEIEGNSFAMLYPTIGEFERIGQLSHTSMRASGLYSDDRIMRRKSGQLSWFHSVGQSMDPAAPFDRAVWMFEDLEATRPVTVELTSRERDVASLLVTGATAKEIARQLGLSPRTVEHYRTRLINKYEVRTTHELITRLVGPVR